MGVKTGSKKPHKIAKGDVVWVPFRRDPNWPALVLNVYPKKITYNFFPLEHGAKKMRVFSLNPRTQSVYALSVHDLLPRSATRQLRDAFDEAIKYLHAENREVGSAAPLRPDVDTLVAMAKKKKKEKNNADSTTDNGDVSDALNTTVSSSASSTESPEKALEELDESMDEEPPVLIDESLGGPSENGNETSFADASATPPPLSKKTSNACSNNGVVHLGNSDATAETPLDESMISIPIAAGENGNSSDTLMERVIKDAARRSGGTSSDEASTDQIESRSFAAASPEMIISTILSAGSSTPSLAPSNSNGPESAAHSFVGEASTSVPVSEVAMRVAPSVVTNLFNNPTKTMKKYALPPRSNFYMRFNTAGVITDDETDQLIERVVELVRGFRPGMSMLAAIHYTSRCLLQPILQQALVEARGLTPADAEAMFTRNEKKATPEPQSNAVGTPASSNSAQNSSMSLGLGNLEQLVRVACMEREFLENNVSSMLTA